MWKRTGAISGHQSCQQQPQCSCNPETATLQVKLTPSGLRRIITLVVKHSPVAKVRSVSGVVYQCSLLVAQSSCGLNFVPLFALKVLIISSNRH